jgi:REP element-mobilizing transposase RayT
MDIKKARFFPGNYYHVYNHAIAWELLFKDEENYSYFLDRFHYYLDPFVELKVYCLMPNHYHLLIRIKDSVGDVISTDKIVLQAFSNFHNSYSKSINKRYNRKGRLYHSTLCRKNVNTPEYIAAVSSYIIMNPVEHGFCKSAGEWKYCSVVQAA